MGANGAGKTSVLWGIALLLRAYNSRCKGSAHTGKETIDLLAGDAALLLNYPPLEHVSLKETFIRQLKDGEEATPSRIVGTICGHEFQCGFSTNGVATFHPPQMCVDEKIRFAFIGLSDSVFEEPKRGTWSTTSSVHIVSFW